MSRALLGVCVLLLSSVRGLLVVLCLVPHGTFINNKNIKRR